MHSQTTRGVRCAASFFRQACTIGPARLGLLLVALWLAPPAAAQSLFGSLSGTVTDAQR